MPTDQEHMLDYVRNASLLMGLKLESAQIGRVAMQLTQASAIYRNLEGQVPQVSDEPAQVYCPAPFPLSKP